MLLKDLCTMDPSVCTPVDTVMDAARLMRTKHVGDLVVVDNTSDKIPVGMVTDRDIVVQVLAEGLDASKVLVSKIMCAHTVVASADESVETVLKRMREFGVRRIPVTSPRGQLFGVVTLDDILRHHAAQEMLLSEVIATEQNHERRTYR